MNTTATATAATIQSDPDFPPPEHPTLPAAFQASAVRVPERVALRTPGDAVSISWAEYAAAVERVAGSLAALGVGRGDRVAFLSRNRPELAIAEVAAMHLGAAGVALYTASPPATIEHVLRDSEPAVLAIESALEPSLAGVRHSVPQTVALDTESGKFSQLASMDPPAGFDFEAAWRTVQPDDLAALLYTSGTTGPAKGVEWTHQAICGWLPGFDAVQPEADGIHDISYGPFAHAGERGVCHWRSLARGSTRTFCEDPTQLGAVLLEARPTFLFGSPRVWQGLKAALEATLGGGERAVLDAGIERVRALAAGGSAAPLTEEQEGVLAALRARVGLDRMSRALTAAAPCPLAVQEHYHGLGVPFYEFYGMTECGPATTTRSGLVDLGTVGPATPGYELRLGEDGEVQVRSRFAPCAYRNRPDANAETYGADGWIRTGDIGELDSEGRLRIVDRKKEMLVPEHGHNCAPAPIESELKSACPLIGQVCVVGDGRPHLAALVVPEPPERAGDDDAREAIAAAIERVNATLDPRERIEAHAVIGDTWLPGAELTETLKLRRTRIAERYAAEIEDLYA